MEINKNLEAKLGQLSTINNDLLRILLNEIEKGSSTLNIEEKMRNEIREIVAGEGKL